MHRPVIIYNITTVWAVHFPQRHFHLVFFFSEAQSILLMYLDGFTPLLSKLPSSCDPNNLEIPWSHLEIVDTKYVSELMEFS